jgi:hypothetical protein
MRHTQLAGGDRHMEVDHFNPTLKGAARNRYRNLMLATRLCNLMKRDKWPKKWQSKNGLRLLNPCEEQDYCTHIFEDPDTHRLIGTTPAGRYHIDACDLNHPSFVWEREKRAEFLRIKRAQPTLFSGTFSSILELVEFVKRQVELFIPEIPAPPKSSPLR